MATEPSQDRDSIDLRIDAGGNMRPKLDIQLKATGPLLWSKDTAPFRLECKNYDDLRLLRTVPALLVVLEMPDEEADWVACGPDELALRRRAWWLSLAGCPDVEQKTRTVRLRNDQQFVPDSLRALMEQTRRPSP